MYKEENSVSLCVGSLCARSSPYKGTETIRTAPAGLADALAALRVAAHGAARAITGAGAALAEEAGAAALAAARANPARRAHALACTTTSLYAECVRNYTPDDLPHHI